MPAPSTVQCITVATKQHAYTIDIETLKQPQTRLVSMSDFTARSPKAADDASSAASPFTPRSPKPRSAVVVGILPQAIQEQLDAIIKICNKDNAHEMSPVTLACSFSTLQLQVLVEQLVDDVRRTLVPSSGNMPFFWFFVGKLVNHLNKHFIWRHRIAQGESEEQQSCTAAAAVAIAASVKALIESVVSEEERDQRLMLFFKVVTMDNDGDREEDMFQEINDALAHEVLADGSGVRWTHPAVTRKGAMIALAFMPCDRDTIGVLGPPPTDRLGRPASQPPSCVAEALTWSLLDADPGNVAAAASAIENWNETLFGRMIEPELELLATFVVKALKNASGTDIQVLITDIIIHLGLFARANDIMRQADVGPALIDAFTSAAANEEAKGRIAWAISHTCSNVEMVATICNSNLCSHIVEAFNSCVADQVKCRISFAISNICIHEEGRRIMRQLGVVHPLICMLRDTASDESRASLGDCICNLAGDDEALDQMLESGVCEALVKALNLARTDYAKDRVAWAIAGCLQRQSAQADFVDRGVCEALVGALMSTHGTEHTNHIVQAMQTLNDDVYHQQLVDARAFDEDVLQRWRNGALVGQIRIGMDGISCTGFSGCSQQ